KNKLPVLIVIGAAILALLFALIMPGAKMVQKMGTSEVVYKANLIGLMFGSTEVVATLGSKTQSITYDGGMSIFGLISFIALVGGLALTVLSFFVADKKFDTIGAVLVALAGVLVLFLLTAGTDLTGYNGIDMSAHPAEFKEVYENYKLGVGAILYAIVAILGGGIGLVMSRKK
ncbi:MAG: hypothetical protein IKA57_04155, partial [Clostridia bacterium]|nr:hypothetical protein [Clostridia bacterium]